MLLLLRAVRSAGLALGLALALSAAARPLFAAPAAQTSGVTLNARGGFDGYYKDGTWVPVRVTVANDGPDLSGTLAISSPRTDGGQTLFTRAVELPTQSRREFFFYVAPEGFVSTLDVTLTSGNRKLATAAVRLVQASANDVVYGVLAGSATPFNILSEVDPVTGTAWVGQLDVSDLPPLGTAWQSLDVLIVSDVDTGVLTPEQRAALAGWVADGGRLIVAGGPNWQKTAAGLLELLPFAPSGTTTFADAGPWGLFAESEPPPGSVVAATGTLAPGAVTLLKAGETPLVTARRSGFGQVVFLAADPAFAPFKGWDGMPGVFRAILSSPLARPSWAGGFRTNWSAANDALNAAPGLDLPSAFQICGFLGLYLIIVGPLNYLVLKRFNRRELAWLTIPVIVLVFSGASYLFGYQLRGGQATLHRLAVVQVWPDSARAQVDAAVGLLSPRRATYDVQFGDGFLVKPMPYQPGIDTLAQAAGTQVNGLRAEIGQMRAFLAQGQVDAPHFGASLTLSASGGNLTLDGAVTNLSDLRLQDVVLLAPGGVLRLGAFDPGETQPIHLALTSGQAAPAMLNAGTPILPPGAKPGSYYPGTTSDTTVDDILGNSNYYQDKALYRRYSLLSAAVNSSNGSGRGGGVYLVGWSATSPLPVTLAGKPFGTVDQSVYFIALRPQLQLGQGTISIPPGAQMWSIVDPGNAGSPMPYNFYIYPGYTFALKYEPAQPVPFHGVRALTLHLTNYGTTGLAPLSVSLWDYTEGVWAPQPNLVWGDTRLPDPARWVSPAGEIQVRVENGATAQASNIEALDFTVVVEQ
jgi:hypothetical protein